MLKNQKTKEGAAENLKRDPRQMNLCKVNRRPVRGTRLNIIRQSCNEMRYEKVINRIYDPRRLREAWHQVKKNKDFDERKDELFPIIHEKLITLIARALKAGIIVEGQNEYLRGWYSYFKIQEFIHTFSVLDGWIRSRLRSMQLKKWKNPRKFQTMMIKAGYKAHEAQRI